MKRCAIVAVVCVCVLIPSIARADDGGWLDWLYRLDAKFWGLATDFHVACFDRGRGPVPHCERWFGIPKLFGKDLAPLEYANVAHEFNVRVAHYWTYGDLFAGNESDSSKAFKLMAFYDYLPDEHITVGLGAGFVHFYGEDLRNGKTSAILTPLSVRYAPARAGDGPWIVKAFFIRGEASYLTDTLTSADFKRGVASVSGGEWNVSAGAGFDLRRLMR